MRVRLRPVRAEELPAFVRKVRDGYARGIEQHAYRPAEEAREKAERDIAGLLPDERVPDGHYLLIVEDEATGDAVGHLWYAERPRGAETVAFVYTIELDAQARGRGLGRQAMLLLEDEVRARGWPAIVLNVFGGNEPARSLYRSLDYAEVSVWMSKELG